MARLLTGKGTGFVPAAHRCALIPFADPGGVDQFGPFRAGSILDTVSVGFAHGYSRSSPSGSQTLSEDWRQAPELRNSNYLLNGFALTIFPPSSMV